MELNDQANDDLLRGVFASFGLAYYESECVHRGLCIALAFSKISSPDLTTGPRVEELVAHAYSLTLGEVFNKLKSSIPPDFAPEVEKAIDARNFLAHHFWFERCHLMSCAPAIQGLVKELETHTELFSRVDAHIMQWVKSMLERLGITSDALAASLAEILEGQVDDQLPSKEAMKELNRKLKNRQRLIRVWEFIIDGNGRPLVFEFADGTLWQLSDVGLGWTRFQEIGPEWTEQSAIKPHLPADILPRPSIKTPWDYEFELAHGVVLWVKPGSRERTFKWGLRGQDNRDIASG